ncbi:MAG: hypothetical protein LC800_10460 [Acidobacteria bacterium]|nr:hypothetical protein [Acidobacteriota bacterium]
MTRFSQGAIPFIAIGTAFLGIGFTGHHTFIYVGLVFIALGFAIILKKSRG